MEAMAISNAVPPSAMGIARAPAPANSFDAAGGGFFQLVAAAVGGNSPASAGNFRGPGNFGGVRGNCVPSVGPKATAKSSNDTQTSDVASAALAASLSVVLAAPVPATPVPVEANSDDAGESLGQEPIARVGEPVAAESNVSATQPDVSQDANTPPAQIQTDSEILSKIEVALTQEIATPLQGNGAAQPQPPVGLQEQPPAPRGNESQAGEPSNPAQKLSRDLADPAAESVMEQLRQLQEAGAQTETKTKLPLVTEVEPKQFASRINVPVATNLPKAPLANSPLTLPVQSPEIAQLNPSPKPAQASPVLNNVKNPAVPVAEAQQKNAARQQSAKQDSQSDTSSDSQSNNGTGFPELVTKISKPNLAPANEQGTQVRVEIQPDSGQAVNVFAPAASHAAVNQDQSIASPQVAAPVKNAVPNWNAPDDSSGKVVNSAQLAEAANHTEMRIAMQTDKLGNIELRAHVAGETVGAAITVEKRDTHSALALELPSLQQALSEKSLRVDHVALFQGSLNLGDSAGGKEMNEQQAQQMQQRGKVWSMESAGTSLVGAELAQAGVFDSRGRLDVRV